MAPPLDPVWAHFVKSKNSEGRDTASCRYCNARWLHRSTGRLKRHTGLCANFPSSQSAIRTQTQPQSQSTRPSVHEQTDRDTTTTTTTTTTTVTVVSRAGEPTPNKRRRIEHGYGDSETLTEAEQKEMERQLAKMICGTTMAWSAIETQPFLDFMAALCPAFKVPSSRYLRENYAWLEDASQDPIDLDLGVL